MPRCRCNEKCERELNKGDLVVEVYAYDTAKPSVYVALDHLTRRQDLVPVTTELGRVGEGLASIRGALGMDKDGSTPA